MTSLSASYSARRTDAGASALALYFAWVVGATALFWPTVAEMAHVWFSSSAYSHGIVIAPLALWMMLHARERAPKRYSTSGAGLVFTIFALALWISGFASGFAPLEQAGFISILIGGFWTLLGDGAARAFAFPLAFLYFMAPVGESLIPALQFITAETVVRLLSALGMAVSLDGNVITTPAGGFEIAEACAGLRYLLSALVVAAVFAHMSFRSWSKRLAFIGVAGVVAIAANMLRAMFLIALATLSEKKLGLGPDHLATGLVFYGVVFFALLAIGKRMGEKRQSSLFAAPRAPSGGDWFGATAFAALVLLGATSLYATVVVERAPRETAAPLAYINAPGWRIAAPPSNWQGAAANADARLEAAYLSSGDTVYVSLSQYAYDRKGAEIASAAPAAYEPSWTRNGMTQRVVYLFGNSEETPVYLFAGEQYRRLAAVTAYWSGSDVFTDPRALKKHQLREKLAGRNPPGGAITIAAAYRRDPDEAVRKIRAFTVDAESFHAWRARMESRRP